jgi:hypothetical protein
MFCALDLNRKNINRAISDNMLKELGMNTNDFNYGQTIFLASFLCAELPSGLISKKLGADRWIPTIIVAWSLVSASQAGLVSKTGYYVDGRFHSGHCALAYLLFRAYTSHPLVTTN